MLSRISYTADGSTPVFAIPFNYLEESDIHVTVNGSAVTDSLLAFPTTNSVQVPVTPTAGQIVIVFRSTTISSAVVQFSQGAFNHRTLNDLANWLMFSIQEIVDGLASTITLNTSGVWDFGGHRLTNLGAPTATTDAATKAYADSVGSGMSASLQIASNLSDLASATTARTNLGLGTAATQSTGTFLQTANNLSEVTAATARTNLGLGTAATMASTVFLLKSNNLSDVTAATARTNLGLGGAAVLSVGTTTGTVAAGDDSRITGAAQKASNLSDLASATTARTNLGLGTAAVAAASAFLAVANNLSDVTAATARTNLGLGTSATHAATDFVLVSNNLSDVIAATARTNLGLGTIATHASTDYLPLSSTFWDAGSKKIENLATPSATTDAATKAYVDSVVTGGGLVAANNLSDLANAATARTNLGLGTAATSAASAFLATANNLSDVTAATARTNLGLGSAAVLASSAVLQTANNLSEVTAATARTNLGLGTAATQSTGTFAQVANNLSDVTAATARTNLGVPPSTRLISTSGALTGGGDLSADRTLTVTLGTTSSSAAAGNDARFNGANGINLQTGTTYTFALTDAGEIVEGNNASAQTYTIPPNSSVAFPVNTMIQINQVGAGKITVSPGAGVTLNKPGGLSACRVQWSSVFIYKRGTNEWTIGGDLA